MSRSVGLYGVRMGKQRNEAGDCPERPSDGSCSGLPYGKSVDSQGRIGNQELTRAALGRGYALGWQRGGGAGPQAWRAVKGCCCPHWKC